MIYPAKNTVTRQSVARMLTDCSIRPTRQRVEIAYLLLARPQHMSADQVLMRVNSNKNMVSKATVYNTLNLFAEIGLVRQVIIDPGKVFYDSNTESHHHIYNEDTGTLQDIDSVDMEVKRMPPLPADVTASGIDIIVRVKNKT